MARHLRLFLLCAAALAAMPAAALAQSAEARTFVSLNGGIQSVTGSLNDHFETEVNVEQEKVDVDYSLKPDLVIDAGLGIRLWKRLGAGVAVSRVTGEHSAGIEASVPHPLQFNQPRAVSGEQGGITRTETGVHVQLQYSIRASRNVTIVLEGGPSWLTVEQEIVTAIKFDEKYPFDDATFTSAVTHRAKASAVGFNAGADLRWMLGRSIGVGGLVRYTRADIDLPAHDTATLAITSGGFQAAAGLRVGF